MPLTLGFITAKYSDNKEKGGSRKKLRTNPQVSRNERFIFYTFQQTGVMSVIIPSFLLQEKLPQLTYFALAWFTVTYKIT